MWKVNRRCFPFIRCVLASLFPSVRPSFCELKHFPVCLDILPDLTWPPPWTIWFSAESTTRTINSVNLIRIQFHVEQRFSFLKINRLKIIFPRKVANSDGEEKDWNKDWIRLRLFFLVAQCSPLFLPFSFFIPFCHLGQLRYIGSTESRTNEMSRCGISQSLIDHCNRLHRMA